MSELATKVTEVKVAALDPNQLRQADHEMQDWLVYAAPGTTDNDILNPAYWALAAPRLRPPARLTIMDESGLWMVDAICVAADKNWAKVNILNRYALSATKGSGPQPDNLEVKWGAPANKWLVIRTNGSQHEVLSKHHATRDIAEEWLRSHRIALTR